MTVFHSLWRKRSEPDYLVNRTTFCGKIAEPKNFMSLTEGHQGPLPGCFRTTGHNLNLGSFEYWECLSLAKTGVLQKISCEFISLSGIIHVIHII